MLYTGREIQQVTVIPAGLLIGLKLAEWNPIKIKIMKYNLFRGRWSCLAGLFCLGFAAHLEATAIDYSLNVKNGFAFNSGTHNDVGYITSLSIAGTNLTADLSVTLPPTPTAITTNVVAVLTAESWGGGASDDLSFSARVSNLNRQVIDELLQGQTLSNYPAVSFSFKIYAYDSESGTWFEAFFPDQNGVLIATVPESGGVFDLSVGSSPATDVTSPVNYVLTMGMAPVSSQTLIDSTSQTISVAKSWGTAISPPSVTTSAATDITNSTAILNGTVNPNNLYFRAGAWFQYGLTTSYGNSTAPAILADTLSSQAVSNSIFRLTAGSTYHYRLVATNAAGTTYGGDSVFVATGTIGPNPFSIAASQFQAADKIVLQFTNLSGLSFTILETTNLALPLTNWTVLGTAVENTAGTYVFTGSLTTNSVRSYYRARWP